MVAVRIASKQLDRSPLIWQHGGGPHQQSVHGPDSRGSPGGRPGCCPGGEECHGQGALRWVLQLHSSTTHHAIALLPPPFCYAPQPPPSLPLAGLNEDVHAMQQSEFSTHLEGLEVLDFTPAYKSQKSAQALRSTQVPVGRDQGQEGGRVWASACACGDDAPCGGRPMRFNCAAAQLRGAWCAQSQRQLQRVFPCSSGSQGMAGGL